MHINSDFVVLEVDRTGLGPAESAPFIVTSLVNKAMPFVRYRNEDCGRLLDGTCDCGNQFPLLELNISRIVDNFILPSGRVVHGEFFTHLIYGSEGISMFQFHQTAPQTIVLWIVPGPGRDEAREKAVRAVIEQVQKLDPAVTVQVREIAAIPLSQAGKHRFTRSDVMENPSLWRRL
jgi:phenylacetate-CoA ligase